MTVANELSVVLSLYSTPLMTMDIMPVASSGTENVSISTSPAVMFTEVGTTNDSTLVTLTVALLELGMYLSSPVYVTTTLYVPLDTFGICVIPTPLVTLT